MIDLLSLEAYCNGLLASADFQDYCPNGVQVEAGERVTRLMVGVTACQRLIDAARDWQADALLVHHGFFWKGEAEPLRGMKGRRIAGLLTGGISLLAYHLPLDAHATFGNNAEFGRRLGLEGQVAEGVGRGLIWRAALPEAIPADAFAEHIGQRLGRQPLHIAGHERPLEQIGWCTGAAQDYLEVAVGLGLDAFISGEVSEPTVHMAREMGIDYFAAGHHATERYGVQALGQHLAECFDLKYRFVDIDNPV